MPLIIPYHSPSTTSREVYYDDPAQFSGLSTDSRHLAAN